MSDAVQATSWRRSPPLDFRLLASMLGLMFIASPALAALNSGLNDAVSGVATLFALPVVLSRFGRNKRVLLWVVIYCTAYLLSTIFSGRFEDQGFRNTFATLTAATALMVFYSYGREMVASRGWRICAFIILAGGAVGVMGSGLPKNITGGTFLYVVAMAVAVLIANGSNRAGVLVAGFFALTGLTAFLFDFRSLIGYTAVLVLGYLGAVWLPKRVFWVVGVIGASTVVAATIWYFLNVTTSEFAVYFTRYVSDTSGRRATSGRDWLWPNIVYVVQANNPWVGVGAGALPRDVMPTDLSSHSYYMQVFLQTGWIGLVLLIGLLLAIWSPLAMSNQSAGHFGAAVFLMFVTHNSTEVLMFQNGLIAGIPAWCVIGLCMSAAAAAASPSARETDTSAPGHRSSALNRRSQAASTWAPHGHGSAI